MTLNTAAYQRWRKTFTGRLRDTAAPPPVWPSPTAACEAEVVNVPTLLSMLHALPYAHVLLASLAPKVIRRLGQAFECEARVQMLRRLTTDASVSAKGRAFCEQWLLAIVHLDSLAMKRRESEKTEAWERLINLMPRAAPRLPMTPQRTEIFLPANEWYHLVAFAIALPQHLPVPLTEVDVDTVCDNALCWLTKVDHIDFSKAVAVSLVGRNWDAITVLFAPDPQSHAKTPQVAATAPPAGSSHERPASGPPRN